MCHTAELDPISGFHRFEFLWRFLSLKRNLLMQEVCQRTNRQKNKREIVLCIFSTAYLVSKFIILAPKFRHLWDLAFSSSTFGGKFRRAWYTLYNLVPRGRPWERGCMYPCESTCRQKRTQPVIIDQKWRMKKQMKKKKKENDANLWDCWNRLRMEILRKGSTSHRPAA